MSASLPEFAQLTRIDDHRSWNAVFDSYDARNDDCYYVVTLCSIGCPTARFMVVVSLLDLDDWTTTGFIEAVRMKVGDVAVRGESNTEYRGLESSWRKAGGELPER